MVDDKMPHACLRARSLLEAFGTGAQQDLAALCGHFQLRPSAGKGWVGLVARYSLGGGEVYHSESRDLGWLARGRLVALSFPLKKSTKHGGFCCMAAASYLVFTY